MLKERPAQPPQRPTNVLHQISGGIGKVAGFSLHAGVAARADQRQKLERLCRYDVKGCTSVAGGRKPGATISRPAISEKRLSLTPNGDIRYQLKTPYREGTIPVILLRASCPSPFTSFRAVLRTFKFVPDEFVSLREKGIRDGYDSGTVI